MLCISCLLCGWCSLRLYTLNCDLLTVTPCGNNYTYSVNSLVVTVCVGVGRCGILNGLLAFLRQLISPFPPFQPF